VTEALSANGALHLALRLAVGEGIFIDVVRGPADYDGVEAVTEPVLGAKLQLAGEAADQLEERNDPALDAHGFVGERRAEDALERSHHPPISPADIGGRGRAAV
jgi:hypothetical protein